MNSVQIQRRSGRERPHDLVERGVRPGLLWDDPVLDQPQRLVVEVG